MFDFDVIVVGSGMSGGWVAKEMSERGFKVGVLERGRKIDKAKDYTDFKEPWELENLGEPTRDDKQLHPVQHDVYAFRTQTRQYWVNDNEHPYETPEGQHFKWYRGHHEGGRSIMWGRQSYRWNEQDFEANKKENIAVDWPVRYGEISKWYDHVERFAGISGSIENLDVLPDGIFQPPFELNCGEAKLKEGIEDSFAGRKLIPGRVANLTEPTKEQNELGRGQCQSRSHCARGCSFGAYFSSNSATLPAAERTGNYTLVPNTTVVSVNYDQEKNRVSGVNVVDSVTGAKKTLTARVVFLNASTIATAVILLNSKSSAFPNGLANSSGQVGHNLMDHILGAGAFGGMYGMQDKYYSGRKPNGFYIPRYRNYSEEGEGYLRGFGFQGGCKRLDWRINANSAGVGKDFKESLRYPTYWAAYVGAFCEMLPTYSNHVRLHGNKLDKDGIPIPVIDMQVTENDKNMVKQAGLDAIDMLEEAGCLFVSGAKPIGEHDPLGAGIHEMGTARMGRDPKTSVLNKWNQAHDIPNLFITDGAFMTSASCVNPSLTYMAFSARAADYAAQQMRDGVI